jgi:hypothetical protein
MTDMRSRRIEIFFMFREFLSLELMGLLKGFARVLKCFWVL